MIIFNNIYRNIITPENIFQCWEEFLVGKKKKKDVLIFERNLEDNLFGLYHELKEKMYMPGDYSGFYVRDPKLRLIHKAAVADRVVHHIVCRELERIFEPSFYAHSYSCRKNKGTHKGVLAFYSLARKASKNNTKTCWVLKCDVKKFFASINQQILLEILKRKIKDDDYIGLLRKIIDSFHSDRTTDISNKKGIPIGNLTSQYFANVYLNDLDQFVKQKLKVKYYVRYADDFVILSCDKLYLENLLPSIQLFLKEKLDLIVHPDKIFFKKFSSGVDFLGYIIFPHYILPRTKTRRRLFRKIKLKIEEYKSGEITIEKLNQTIQSYLGYLSHANSYKLRRELKNLIWYWLTE